MTGSTIRFWFDFASPYAYCALDGIEEIGRETGRKIEWKAMLNWAVLKAQGIAAPFDSPARRAYLLHDMQRSASFHGLPWQDPVRLPLSTHLAARLFLAATDEPGVNAAALARDLFAGYCAEGRDISDRTVLIEIADRHRIGEAEALAAMDGPRGRSLLEANVATAVAEGVCGSPWFTVDGEAFFGVDRLPQLRWRLSAEAGQNRQEAFR